MARSSGNRRLKAARLASGYPSQQALAEALTAAAPELGLRTVSVGARQVRRWESSSPPWPLGPQQQLLRHVLGIPVEQLGFSPPWADARESGEPTGVDRRDASASAGRTRVVVAPYHGRHGQHPSSLAGDFARIAAIYRSLYWTVDPLRLHPVVVEHVRLGQSILSEAAERQRQGLAATLAESAMLVGRIEFFDLRQPDSAGRYFIQGLQFAADAQDSVLGAALLAHSAFIPGWSGDRDNAADRLAAARAHARRGKASSMFKAWLDAVEAECLTKCGDSKGALAMIDRAEEHARCASPANELPEWMDWFSPVRLLAFKGNTQLKAGRYRRARETLTGALATLPDVDTKQRAVILADLAAVEIAANDPERACSYVSDALDQLAMTWYSTAMDRVRALRRELRPWQDQEYVKQLDDQLFSWEATFTTVRS